MSKMNLKAIKQRIRKRREELDLFQEDVANKLGMHRSGYSAAERIGSDSFFTVEQVYYLAGILKTSYSFIFDGIEKDTVHNKLIETIETQKKEIKRLTEFADTLYDLNKMMKEKLEAQTSKKK